MFQNRETLAESTGHELALDCLQAGIEAAQPARGIERHCALDGDLLRIRDAEYDLSAYEEVLIVGGGKAADGLAAALEDLLGDRLSGGIVVTHEQTASPNSVSVRIGEHPVPGDGSVSGATAVLDRVAGAGEQTLVLAAITGGGSALLCAPRDGLTVADLRAVTDGLLDAGAKIDDVNTVRRACSKIKGGGLAAAAAPAIVVGVLMSDVVGDDPAVIASGPTVPAKTDPADALAVLDRYDLAVPTVREFLKEADSETTQLTVDNHIIVSGRDAIEAARTVADERGYRTCLLSTRIEGEAREAGRFHAAIAAEALETGEPVEPPAVLLSGGETTVDVQNNGAGGPNLEFVLAGGLALPDSAVLAAVDTDGSDGSTDAAGALLDSDSVDDDSAARKALAANDTYSFLDSSDVLLYTGATGTNVNDLRILVV